MNRLWLVEEYFDATEESKFTLVVADDMVKAELMNGKRNAEKYPFVDATEVSEVDGYGIMLVPKVDLENSTQRLSQEDNLRLDIMYDLITSEVEYCLSLGYNSDEHWTFDERIESLVKVIQTRAKQSIEDILGEYDYDYFDKNIHDRVKELFHKEYKLGDKITLNFGDGITTGTIVYIESQKVYGLLLDGEYKITFTKSTVEGTLFKVGNPTDYVKYLEGNFDCKVS